MKKVLFVLLFASSLTAGNTLANDAITPQAETPETVSSFFWKPKTDF